VIAIDVVIYGGLASEVLSSVILNINRPPPIIKKECGKYFSCKRYFIRSVISKC
jgi:hypothetical protein